MEKLKEMMKLKNNDEEETSKSPFNKESAGSANNFGFNIKNLTKRTSQLTKEQKILKNVEG